MDPHLFIKDFILATSLLSIHDRQWPAASLLAQAPAIYSSKPSPFPTQPAYCHWIPSQHCYHQLHVAQARSTMAHSSCCWLIGHCSPCPDCWCLHPLVPSSNRTRLHSDWGHIKPATQHNTFEPLTLSCNRNTYKGQSCKHLACFLFQTHWCVWTAIVRE